ncbi:hypothetical protein GGR57DRAFT_476883 [Xylariaceae sp. FL1272]|nr:hypothetical protein GGR57DRAFT_476883 [Xylariaceae sp. FL1272]
MSLTRPVTCAVVDFDGVGLQHMYVTADCLRRGDGVSVKFESFTDSQGAIDRWFRCAEPPTFFEQVDARGYERICLTFSTALYFSRLQTPWVTVQTNIDAAEFENSYVRLQFGPGNGMYSVRTTATSTLSPANQYETELPALAGDCAGDTALSEPENGQASEPICCDNWQYLCSPIPEVPSPESSPVRMSSTAPSESPLLPPELVVGPPSDAGSGLISPLRLPSPQLGPVWSPRITRARARRFSPSNPGRVTRSRKRKVTFEDELEPPRKRRRLE